MKEPSDAIVRKYELRGEAACCRITGRVDVDMGVPPDEADMSAMIHGTQFLREWLDSHEGAPAKSRVRRGMVKLYALKRRECPRRLVASMSGSADEEWEIDGWQSPRPTASSMELHTFVSAMLR